MLSISQQTGGGQSNVFVGRLYSSIRALDEKFGMQESLDT
jgi:hypothetical protein